MNLYYWPHLPGRGEFVRLLLEDAGLAYVDVARLPVADGGGIPALQALRADASPGLTPFAPPILVDGTTVVAQVAAVLHHVATTRGLIAPDVAVEALQVQLTVADVVAEVHDTHHPVSTALYYEDQREAAIRAAAAFRAERLPRWIAWFERALARGDGHLAGRTHSYADLSAFQLLEGLEWAFPRAMARHEAPRLRALRDRVRARPNIAAYLASPRRLAFNEHGIFRRYPELDEG
jgi:glutathione S-transferase